MSHKCKIYLDNCVLNRPFDKQSSVIRLETIAFFSILQFIEQNKLILVSSEIVEYENSKNPFQERKIWVAYYTSLATVYQKINQKIIKRSEELEQLKIMSIDALHLSCAEEAKVDYFITCDYDIKKRYQGQLIIIDPVSFVLNI